jgi:transposase
MNNNPIDNSLTEYAVLVGLDWGHETHAIALQMAGGAIETLSLQHSAENLHQWLDQLAERCAGHSVAVAVEASKGGIVYALLERSWITVYPIHPATSTRHRSTFRPSGAKDDMPDALVLLSLLQHHRERLRSLVLDEEPSRMLAGLVQGRRKAVDHRTQLSNQLKSTLRDYFPQALELIGEDLAAPLALDFLDKWPRLTDAQASKQVTLKNFYHRHNVRRPELIQARLKRVHAARCLTRDAAVIEPAVCMVRLLVGQLRVLQEHIAAFQSAISHTFSTHPHRDLFRQLPGAGPAMAPRLAAAFGTVLDRFEDAAATQRYFGVAPVTEKSGSRKWVHWRWNAPPFLRQTMVEWAGQTVVYCPWAKAYYQHQKAKGVSHWAILRALAFKWLRILWPCWQQAQPYDEEKYLRQLELRRSPIAALARRYAQTMNT